jgi:hypothetical protein
MRIETERMLALAIEREAAFLPGRDPSPRKQPHGPRVHNMGGFDNFRPSGGLGEAEERKLRGHCLHLQERVKGNPNPHRAAAR